MTAKPQFGLADALLLLLVVALGAGARAGYLMVLADGGRSAGPLQVQDPSPELRPPSAEGGESPVPMPTELGALAHSLRYRFEFASLAPLSGGEREPTAHVAPGYPFLVSLVDRVVPDDSVGWAVRWGQCGLGALTAGLYFLFGWYAFRSRSVALLAGLFCALHPFWIVNTAALADGTVTAFVLGLVLYTGAVASRDAAAFHSLVFGLALAGLALLRAALLPFAFVALVWFLWRSRRLDRGWLCALLAFLGFVNGLAPWTIRNFQAYDEPVPVVDSTYLHLYMGNNRLATGGPQTEETLLKALAEERGVDVEALRRELAGMPQPARYRSLAADYLNSVRTRPADTLQHRFEATASFFMGEAWLEERRVAEVTEASEGAPDSMPGWLATTYTSTLLGTLLFMYGLGFLGWRWTYVWRNEAKPSALALVWIPLPYILGHAEWLHGPRLPLDGVLLTYAAFALCCFLPGGSELYQGPPADETPGRR